MNIESRLGEWADWLNEPGFNAFPGESISYKMMHGDVGGSGASDGGMMSAIKRMGYIVARDGRAREIAGHIQELPEPYKAIICSRYIVSKREKPRSLMQLAQIHNLDVNEVRKRLAKAEAWLAGRCGDTLV